MFGELEGSIVRRAAAAALEYRLTSDVTLQLGAGLGHGGALVIDDGDGIPVRHEMLPGWVATASGSWRVVDGAGASPFVLLSATLGASGARTRESASAGSVGYTAIDMRLGVAVGKTFFHALSPYVAARAFGGPISWRFRGEDRTGTDQHHYQLGLGLAVALPSEVDVLVEGVPLGERAMTLGVGRSF